MRWVERRRGKVWESNRGYIIEKIRGDTLGGSVESVPLFFIYRDAKDWGDGANLILITHDIDKGVVTKRRGLRDSKKWADHHFTHSPPPLPTHSLSLSRCIRHPIKVSFALQTPTAPLTPFPALLGTSMELSDPFGYNTAHHNQNYTTLGPRRGLARCRYILHAICQGGKNKNNA